MDLRVGDIVRVKHLTEAEINSISYVHFNSSMYQMMGKEYEIGRVSDRGSYVLNHWCFHPSWVEQIKEQSPWNE